MSGLPLRPTLRTLALTAGAALLVAGIAIHPNRVLADDAATLGAPAPASVPTTSPEPIPVQETGRRHHHHKKAETPGTAASSQPIPAPAGSATPAAPVYTTFAGTWEVAMQPGARTAYSHFKFDPTAGTALTGIWLRGDVAVPITGEIDGDRFRLAGTDAQGPFTMTGYEESSTTMIGLMIQGKTRVSFTAAHESSPGAGKTKTRHHKSKHGSDVAT